LPAVLAELFPTRLRTTGLSISYAFAVAIFGGGAPFLNTWLIQATGSNLVPSYYLIFAAAISLIALLAARSQTARPLQPEDEMSQLRRCAHFPVFAQNKFAAPRMAKEFVTRFLAFYE